MTNAHGLSVLSNCYTFAGFIFPGGSSRINWAYEGKVYPLILKVEVYSRSAREYTMKCHGHVRSRFYVNRRCGIQEHKTNLNVLYIGRNPRN